MIQKSEQRIWSHLDWVKPNLTVLFLMHMYDLFQTENSCVIMQLPGHSLLNDECCDSL